ncbi:hypothetical protein TNIN_198631 [Trichonephila inaurata madagascariensis]|uniref:Uncharacterized protein n=1 Tax=Trichonephila inaurata madagascariensis TaxID=2747483 RepID=A0A8X6YVE2_9ARAC|nr:hypothetical protein TNIN_198631 [Trichonephila inaurata madagascariensis]
MPPKRSSAELKLQIGVGSARPDSGHRRYHPSVTELLNFHRGGCFCCGLTISMATERENGQCGYRPDGRWTSRGGLPPSHAPHAASASCPPGPGPCAPSAEVSTTGRQTTTCPLDEEGPGTPSDFPN